jgi:hypothetical protein
MQCFTAIFFAEAWASNRALIEQHPDEVGPDVTAALSLSLNPPRSHQLILESGC